MNRDVGCEMMTSSARRTISGPSLSLLVTLAAMVLLGSCAGSAETSADSAATPSASATATRPPGPDPSADPTATVPPSTPEPTATTTSEPDPTPGPDPTEQPSPSTGVVYFMFDGYPTQVGPYLVPVARPVDDPDDLLAVLRALAEGPTQTEVEQYLSSAIPDGTMILGVEVDDGIATVDVSSRFESGGGSLSMLSRVAQIVYTATRAPDVDAVLFTMEGEPLTVLGGEGLLLEEPQARSGYHDLLPEIAIESPVWGGRSTDELVLAGTADLDTPSFTVVLVDAVGTIVAEEEVEVERDGDSRGRFGLEIGDLEVWPVSVVVYDSEGDGRQVAVLQYPLSP